MFETDEMRISHDAKTRFVPLDFWPKRILNLTVYVRTNMYVRR